MTKITKGVFEPDDPLYEVVNGRRYALYNCAFCDGGYEHDAKGRAVVWTVHGMCCCSEMCAKLYVPHVQPRFRTLTEWR
jgi:hypothetical protein